MGTYDIYQRRLEYPDGKEVILELLCLPGGVVEQQHAAESLEALHGSVMWTYVSCGPEACDHAEERQALYALLTEREQLKTKIALKIGSTLGLTSRVSTAGKLITPLPAVGSENELKSLSPEEGKRLGEVRSELKRLISEWRETGYQYTGQIYREIAMENSDYGIYIYV